MEEELDVDQKDLDILAAIGTRKATSSKEISDETGIPKSTVHYRIQQLREMGVLKNDLFELDLEKVGLSVTVISEVFAEFEEGYHTSIGEKLAAVEGVNQVYFTMGETDFVVISHLHDREMVKRLVEDFEAIDGIQKTSSKFVIEPVKHAEFPIADFDAETIYEMLD
ncbi:DNA-binding transcriptional regulator, Lrp family [Halanaeroarchaeum sp. HSR-CO]|uniref:Lrp/AsnC family transcriptional regulator n=1 Tax=Halanaeroarchaeum sp. HSR-CO TaxID=2866382 RepID=UPI00217D032D|nr:Lrp/AsnC family transcriptional regulator [Halanaeroarchaeum sp. HSR-CO]UWG48283.1 DNA-binding transcriptional regulator, Lrp family [Halanaeroarchaeum sp. HSR-CO]